MLSRVLGLSPARVRARALTLVAGAAAVIGVAGCAAATSGTVVTVTGRTLTIYSAVPASVASDPVVRDVADAEQLAFTQKAKEVTSYKLSFQRLTSSKLSDNARTAIQDKSAIAYIGEIVPGASADTLGITNAQDLLQVSPTDTAAEETQSIASVPGSPTRYYESLKTYGRTFARVVPTTDARGQGTGPADALARSQAPVPGDRRRPLRQGDRLRSCGGDAPASAITIIPSQSGADGIFYGGSDQTAAARSFAGATATNPKVQLFGPSAVASATLTAGLPTGTPKLYVSVPGFLPKDLNPAGQTFVSDFRKAYGRSPLPEAIFGYEAVASVIDVLKQAGASANNRSAVVHDFFAIKNRSSVLGTYSINVNGDTSLGPFVFERVQAGALAPFKFLPVKG